jgi:hypothetical protein
MHCRMNSRDIETYIDDTIDEKVNAGDLKVGKPDLTDDIKGALVRGAQRM